MVTMRWFAEIPARAASEKPLSKLSSAHLDAVRGLAAIAVFLGHWRTFWWPHYNAGATSLPVRLGYFLTGFPHEAVIVFFVLSGFLVGGSVLRSIGKWQWRGYLITRLSRLWTVLIPALVIGGALDVWGGRNLGLPFYTGHSVAIYWDVAARLSPATFACNALFLQTINCEPLGSNGVLWSLANEFWYYLIFPMIVLAIFGKERLIIRIAYLALAAVCLVFVGRSIAFLFVIWLMGAAISVVPRLKLPRWQVLCLQTGLLLVAIGGALFSRFAKGLAADFVLGVTFSAFVWAIASSEGRAASMYARISGFISAMSYTLYLVHLPALVFVSSYLIQTKLSIPLMGFISAGIVAVYSYILYFVFEKRTPQVRALVKRIVDRPAPQPSPAQS